MFRWFKKLIASQEVQDQENYHRLVESIRDAACATSYDYPTVKVLCSWLLAHVHPGPTIEDLTDALVRLSPDEAPELAKRLQRALDDVDQQVRH